MESFGHERSVQQGENWNLDILLSASNQEYIPYIISSNRTNPYFVTTVASTKYEKNLRYVKSFWSQINHTDNTKNTYTPLFFSTVPVYCGELEYVDPDAEEPVLNNLPTKPGEGTFADITNEDYENTKYLYQYIKASDPVDYEIGHKEYHYFYFNYQYIADNILANSVITLLDKPTLVTSEPFRLLSFEIDSEQAQSIFTLQVKNNLNRDPVSGDMLIVYECELLGKVKKKRLMMYRELSSGDKGWVNAHIITRVDNYECKVIYNFPSEITAEWAGQNYMYQITLVSGPTLEERLNEIYEDKLLDKEITEKEWPTNIEEQYKYVKLMWPNELQPDIDIDSPIGRILQPQPILPPTKLHVFNNLRTII